MRQGSELLSALLLGFSALPPPFPPSETPGEDGRFPPCCHGQRDEDLAGLWPWRAGQGERLTRLVEGHKANGVAPKARADPCQS